MVSFSTAIKNFFKKGLDFRGTATRAEFWWPCLLLFVFVIFWTTISATFLAIFTNGDFNLAHLFASLPSQSSLLTLVWMFITLVLGILIFIPFLAVQTRRFRDTDLSEPLVWIALVASLIGNYGGASAGVEVLSEVLSVIVIILSVLPTHCFANVSWLSRNK
ncbi:uncharacterized membrane protein YhaH (DUF805 family) [Weissella uvarum]|uniref:DUF805 domain-containing protein n=1 Tax=Weissella uvarum TaxID=1479233 RepID=UPI00195F6AA8|nr:DUF805 domain-containing protein [Weissella uvarum]MBM7617483.1 uncharacterized membrane protein YhaH (DUF805 family) [Weissella uvarum]MCM0595633.1 DUF805 domain-containing protein [Weissella uvarum]